jgi:phosphopantothenate synthetase
MSLVRGIGRFCYDFVIGDDWKIAAAVVLAVLAGAVLLLSGTPIAVVAVATAGLIGGAFVAAVLIDVRGR